MVQVAGLPKASNRVPGVIVAGTAGLALVVVGIVIALGFRGGSGSNPSESIAVPVAGLREPRPAGVITYEVTGKGLFTTNSHGAALGTASYEHLHDDGQVAAAVDTATSPDGKYIASILRNSDGVFLAVSGKLGTRLFMTQLAAGDDPTLVAGGKGHARAVEGVPLVVAWSPDSKQLAFGSVTEPYNLGLVSSLDAPNPRVIFSQVTGGYVGELAWAPDGQQLAISTYSLDRLNHSVLLADPATGNVRTLIDGCHITWSPDSEYVAIHRDPGVEAGAWIVKATDKSDRWAISREEKAFPLTWREG